MIEYLMKSAQKITNMAKKPEGPKDFFVYKGEFGIYFATNGRVKACWIKPCTLCIDDEKKILPGFWKDVNSNKKVEMDGTTLVKMSNDEMWQHATGHF